MYNLIDNSTVYESKEVDTIVSGIRQTADTASNNAASALAKANQALSETDRIDLAYNKADEAYNKTITYDTVVNNTLEAAATSLQIAESAQEDASVALRTAEEALSRVPVKYVDHLPSNVLDIVYGVKNTTPAVERKVTTFIDIVGTYFTVQSSNKYVLKDNYNIDINGISFGSVYISKETVYCYTSRDFENMIDTAFNTYDQYSFIITEIVDRMDYYIGNSRLHTYVQLASHALVTNNYIQRTEKGAPGGVATLDTDGHILYSQLPVNTTVFRGTWDASTGVYPTEHVTPGDFFIVTVAGTVDGVEYLVDDRIYWTGSSWNVTHAPEGVTSINDRKGIVVLTAADIGALPTDNPTFNGMLQQNTCTAYKKSVALGDNSVAKGDYSMAVGVRNVIDKDYLFVIGNGTASKRDNAFAVDINNNLFVRHELYRAYSAMHGPSDDLRLKDGAFRYMSKVVWGNDIIYDKNAVDYTGHADANVVVYDGERVNVIFMSALAEGVNAYNIDCIVENRPTVANLENPEYCVYRVYKISVFNTTEAPITFNVNSEQFSVLNGEVITTDITQEYTVPPMTQLSILVVNERQFKQKIANAIWN